MFNGVLGLSQLIIQSLQHIQVFPLRVREGEFTQAGVD